MQMQSAGCRSSTAHCDFTSNCVSGLVTWKKEPRCGWAVADDWTAGGKTRGSAFLPVRQGRSRTGNTEGDVCLQRKERGGRQIPRQIQPVTALPRIALVLILPALLCLYCQRLHRRKDSPASFIKMHPVASRYNSRTPAILRCTIHQPTHV